MLFPKSLCESGLYSRIVITKMYICIFEWRETVTIVFLFLHSRVYVCVYVCVRVWAYLCVSFSENDEKPTDRNK